MTGGSDVEIQRFTPDIASRHGENLTREVASFVVDTDFAELPQELLDLSSKSILDGLGLALSGSVAKSGRLVQEYLLGQGLPGNTTVLGTSLRLLERFSAFANGVAMHADDYDDTQLAVGPDRVYGLLTHPTAPCLPAALAIAENGDLSGRDLILAYNVGVEVEAKIAEAMSPNCVP